MHLEDYLDELKKCPDEQLTDELGIYDNWPIFLNANFDFILDHLRNSTEYVFKKSFEAYRAMDHVFNYVPGTVELTFFNRIPYGLTTGSGCNKQEKVESERQLRDYTMTIMLYPYQKKQIEDVPWRRAMAIVIDDIGQFAIRENIPVCMPRTIGWKHLHDMDYSRIVYHEPKMVIGPA